MLEDKKEEKNIQVKINSAKIYYKKMNKNYKKYSFNFRSDKIQKHIFKICIHPLKKK